MKREESLANRSTRSTSEIKHKYDMLQAVKFRKSLDEDYTYSYIIGRFGKVPKNAEKPDSPYYLVAGYGPAIWENHLEPLTKDEEKKFMKGVK